MPRGKTVRKKAVVSYDHKDISHIGETYKGYHPYGSSVYFRKEDGTTLKWLTVLSPHRVSQVELHIGETVEISYSTRGFDDRGQEWIENVRFLKKEDNPSS